MNILLYILWPLGATLYIRASQLAKGQGVRKIFKKESFLLNQQISATVFLLGLINAIIAQNKYSIYLFAVNLLILSLFYLQPTPRTTRKLLWLFMLANAIFVALIVLL